MAALPGTSATPSDPIDKQIRPACRCQVPPDAFPLVSLPLLVHLYTIPGTRVLSPTEWASAPEKSPHPRPSKGPHRGQGENAAAPSVAEKAPSCCRHDGRTSGIIQPSRP